jgi:cytochrome c-type biogenesis protein CcmE
MLSKYKKKRLIFIGTTLVISLLALVFIIKSFQENIVFFYSPKELEKVSKAIKQRQIRVGGLVEKGTVKRIDALNSEFVITDYTKTLKINYHGILPDLFREGQGIVAKGEFDEGKWEFNSSELLVKHDEKYMPPEVAEAIKHGEK